MEELIKIIRDKFYTKIGLFIGYVFLILFFIPLIFSIHNLTIYIISPITLLLWTFFWSYFQNHFPKTTKGKKGIFIIYQIEEDNEQKIKLENRLNNDIIKSIELSLKQNNLSSKLQIHNLNDFQKKKLITILTEYGNKKREADQTPISYEKLLKIREIRRFQRLNKRIRGCYYIWGDLRKRKSHNENYYNFRTIDGLVIHHLTTIDISKRLAEEFSNLLTSNYDIKEIDEIKGFNDYSYHHFIVALYIIGIAALISHETNLAYELHKIVYNEIKPFINYQDRAKTFFNNFKNTFSEDIYLLANELINKKDYINAKKLNDENLLFHKDNINILHQRIVIEFFLNNIKKAHEFNDRLKSLGDKNWIYNKVFLLLYSDNFREALIIFNQLEKTYFKEEEKIVQSCIDHDISILENNPKLIFLNFIIGFLYYIKQKKAAPALEHFEIFVDYYQNHKNLDIKNFVKTSKKYVKEIKRDLNIK